MVRKDLGMACDKIAVQLDHVCNTVVYNNTMMFIIGLIMEIKKSYGGGKI